MYVIQKRLLCAALLLSSLIVSVGASSANSLNIASSQQGGSLAQIALQRELHKTRHWRRLFHFDEGETHSRAKGDQFFLSSERSLESELLAAIKGFSQPSATASADDALHCRFPERFAWLKQQLAPHSDTWVRPDCPKFDVWLKSVDAQKTTLVFPDAYIASPPSMFGHTFLRLDTTESLAGHPLLAYAVNYAARTDETSGIAFAIRGLAGGYDGAFGFDSYYKKVKEYGYLEHRDLWEYPLKLSSAEINRLLRHLWELQDARFSYFFFTRNCSYQLLKLLEVARPELAVTANFNWWAIPADTVRVLGDQDLLGEAHRRPSESSKMQQALQQLSPEEIDWVLRLRDGDLSPTSEALQQLPESQRAKLFDLSHSLLYRDFQQDKLDRKVGLARSRQLLLARNQLGKQPIETQTLDAISSPDSGHDSARIGIGVGQQILGGRSQDFAFLRVRPAFHDLLDRPAGYQAGAQIDVLNIELRVVEKHGGGGRLEFGASSLLELQSLNARNAFSSPISWRAGAGLSPSAWTADENRPAGHLAFAAHGAGGFAWQLGNGLYYGLIGAEFTAQSRLEKGHRFAPELSVGGLYRRGLLGLNLELRSAYGVGGTRGAENAVKLGLDWAIAEQQSLRFEADVYSIDGDERATLHLGWQHYL